MREQDDPDADDQAAGLSDLERLVAATGLPSISRNELREGSYLFYAVICTEQGSGYRIGFVRQSDPHRAVPGASALAATRRCRTRPASVGSSCFSRRTSARDARVRGSGVTLDCHLHKMMI